MSANSNVGYLLNHVAFILGRQSDQVLQEQLGIGFSQFKIMMVLRENPAIQQKQIADKLGQTEASISRQIKILHDKSFLNTRINIQNKREHITTLTTSGERITERAMVILNNYHRPTFAALDAKQQQQLTGILNIMHNTVCTDAQNGFGHL